MTWLVIGCRGQLGTDLMSVVGADAVGLDVPDIDITDPASVASAVRDVAPDVVVNCAAYTAVDDAEDHEAAAAAINGEGVANIARACPEARLVQISTDYVFDGTAASPYAEDATPAPRSAYGRTKLAGERAALSHPHSYVLRTAWLYGAHGQNFVKTMLHLERTRETVSVVDDQVGQPTYAVDVAEQKLDLGGEVGVAAAIDHVVAAAAILDKTLLVDHAEVAGVQPAVAEAGEVLVGQVPVVIAALRGAQGQLPLAPGGQAGAVLVAGHDLDAVGRQADGVQLVGVRAGVEDERAGALGEAVLQVDRGRRQQLGEPRQLGGADRGAGDLDRSQAGRGAAQAQDQAPPLAHAQPRAGQTPALSLPMLSPALVHAQRRARPCPALCWPMRLWLQDRFVALLGK